ncbi:hypothetical protein WJX74_008533 [Apatococcus lobatus]|uniref:Mitochondrial import inner membrane translocase subunit TIM22 n=1 Tax=Apatococcus lobatus TaxID=904363 RepID=A0AAW1QBP6_9CHLO
MPSHKRTQRSADQPASRAEGPTEGQELVITGEQAVQQALAEAVSQQTPTAQGEAYEPPCSIGGLMAGFTGGMLGYVFGFGGYQFKHKGPGRLKASHIEGWTSARTFAIMGAIFAAASCFSKRLRLKDDVWNGVVAGASTGLVLGWKSGPVGALQSAVSLGAFSYVCDLLGSRAETRSAHAACLPQAQPTSRELWHRRLQLTSQRQQQQQLGCSHPSRSLYHKLPCSSYNEELLQPQHAVSESDPSFSEDNGGAYPFIKAPC